MTGEAATTSEPRGREGFERAAQAYLDLLDDVPAAKLDEVALGEWTLRDLIGHTSRSFSLVETYLAQTPEPGAPLLAGSGEYFRAAMSASRGSSAAITERGRDAGAALGDDPILATRALADRVLKLVAETPDDAPVVTRWGVLRLDTYLPSRAFELTVHGLDIARAIGVETPHSLAVTARHALDVLLATAAPEQATVVLLAMTGRAPLPEDFSIIS